MKRTCLQLSLSVLTLLSMTSCTEERRKRIHADWTKDPKELYEYGDYLIRNRPRNFYKDGEEGEQYIERAANMGYKEAMRDLGSLYAPGYRLEDQKKSIDWYTRAAEAGDGHSMFELEKVYRYGRMGIQVDTTKAEYWRKRLAEQKIKDEENRLAPLRSKAEGGDVKSMLYMGRTQEGRGEAYWKDAVGWYVRAGDAGNAEACMRLVEAYKEGKIGLPKDEVKCDQWFRKWQQAMKEKSARHD